MESINNVEQLVKSFAKHFKTLKTPAIPAKAQDLLKRIYENAEGLPASETITKSGELKAPLIISFHPKLSLLNNNVHEALLCSLIAKELDMVPLWMPYVYDTATKQRGKRYRPLPLFYFEGKYLQLRAPSQIRGNLIGMESPLKDSEIKGFVSELKSHFTQSIQELKKYLDSINFGHELFPMKLKLMKMNPKEINTRLSNLEADLIKFNKGSKTLGHSLARFSVYLLSNMGIMVYPMMVDFMIPEIFGEILADAISRPAIKNNPEILEGLFLWFDKKTKERTPIQFTGEGFIAFDDNANKVFEGGLQDFTEAMKKNDIIPTGPSLMLLFNAIGCKITLGGTHTLEYYPEYIANSNKILKETDYDHTMKLFCYGGLRYIDSRNTGDILAVARVLEKAGSRNIASSGSFQVPESIVDHLNFLAGPKKVPLEYAEIVEALPPIKRPSVEKETERYKEFTEYYNMKPEDLSEKIKELKKFIPTLDLKNSPTAERLRVLVENYWADIDMRYRKMLQMIELEQHLLGGSLPKSSNAQDDDMDDEDDEDDNVDVIYHGILKRSHRVPSLLELVLYLNKIPENFNCEYNLNTAPENPDVLSILIEKKVEKEVDNKFSEF